MIHTGDCVEVMAGMDAASVDAIVTDPPYGLEFMGKEWDALDTPRWRAGHGGLGAPSGTNEVPFGGGGQRVRYGHGNTQAWHEAWATAALRVAKPGAYLLAFGGTRTVHRLTCALEDAGWVIRDTLCWVYASGFPKSRALLKPAWEPILAARKPFSVPVQYEHDIHHALAALIWLLEGSPEGRGCTATRVASLFADGETTGTSRSRAAGSTSLSIASSWASILAASSGAGSRYTISTAIRLTTALRTLLSCLSPVTSTTTMPPCGCLTDGSSSSASDAVSGSTAEWESSLDTLKRSALASAIGPIAHSVAAVCASIAADLSDDRAADGTALAPATMSLAGSPDRRLPAWEPIVMARKPGPLRELAIDECRIGTDEDNARKPALVGDTAAPFGKGFAMGGEGHPAGRWPANVILTDPVFDGGWDGVVGGGSSDGMGRVDVLRRGATTGQGMGYGSSAPADARETGYGDTSTTYSRFFLIPKASRSDREPLVAGELERAFSPTMGNGIGGREHDPAIVKAHRRNTHPTVKPLALMRHLVRLVTPKGGLVLDPFLGSGTTALACEQEGFAWVGIEREPDYVAIAEQRLVDAQRGMAL